MALSTADKVTVAEITRETYGAIDDLAGSLNAEQIASIQDDVDTWETIRNSHVRLKGGSDGVDFDNQRKRDAIRERIRRIFGLSLLFDDSSGSRAIENSPVF